MEPADEAVRLPLRLDDLPAIGVQESYTRIARELALS
jgi:hypothetical protein